MVDILYSIYVMATMGNIFLLLVLLYIFAQDYRKVRSQFTLGLVLFASLLMLNALLSCPITSIILVGGSCCAAPGFVSCAVHDVSVNTYAAVLEFIGLLVFTYFITK